MYSFEIKFLINSNETKLKMLSSNGIIILQELNKQVWLMAMWLGSAESSTGEQSI